MRYQWLVALSLIAITAAPLAGQEPVTETEPAAPSEPAAELAEPQEAVPLPEVAPEGAPPPAPAAEGAAVPGVGETAKQVAGSVVSAVGETAGTVVETGAGVAREGRALWSDVLLPMWQRFATALPAVTKAMLVLLVFWLIAILMGAGVRRLLGLTRLDERAASEWGLANMLRTKEGEPRSIERLAGTAVKWLILLFGFVAFFQALDLGMVAGPLQGIGDRIVGVIPNLLQAAVILLVYWVVASLLRLGVGRGLAAIGFDEKAGRFIAEREIKGEMVRPSGLVGRLVFYVVLIFGLPPFLDALGQRSLVAPLSEMLEKMLAFLPNVVGALVIFFLGHLIATVVREIVTNFLAATGADAGIRRLGLGEMAEKFKVSEIAGSVAYFFIIIPVIAAAVESLQIRAISDPVTRTLETLLAAVPLVFVALVVVGVGYFLARIVRGIVQSFLSGVGFDALPAKLGLGVLERQEAKLAPSAVVGTIVMLVIVLLTVEQALATLQLDELAELIGRLIAYLPQLLVGLVLILAAWSLSGYVARLVEAALGEKAQGRLLSVVTRYAILVFGAGLALIELGIGESLISVAVAAVLGGAALALGLAFGLGGRDRAKQLIERTEAR